MSQKRDTTPKVLSIMLLLIGIATITHAFDITRLPPIADRNIRTGNKMLVEREMNVDNTTAITTSKHNADYIDVNELPVRYDEMQLWRIYNISKQMRSAMPVGEMFESKFGGVIWREDPHYVDVSVDKEHLGAARNFLAEHEMENELLVSNVQDLIDQERLVGIENSQSEPGSRQKKDTRSGIHWKDYHDLDVIYGFMREIRGKFPNICRLYTIGKTAEGRDLKVLRVSENPRDNKKIWIDGGIHAREWISPASVTFILYQIMSNWEDQPKYIKDKTWYFMPVMNPDGYMYSRRVNRLWRKNRALSKRSNCVGVDLNRNFDISWKGFGSSTNPCSDTYRGTAPASELETSAVVKFLTKRKYNLEAYLTFHSYGQMIAYPWAYKNVKVRDAADLQRVGNTASQRIEKQTGVTYRAASTHEVLGIAGGGSDDWCRAALGTKYVYTIELRDRGQHQFILPPDQIKDTGLEAFIITETVAQAIV